MSKFTNIVLEDLIYLYSYKSISKLERNIDYTEHYFLYQNKYYYFYTDNDCNHHMRDLTKYSDKIKYLLIDDPKPILDTIRNTKPLTTFTSSKFDEEILQYFNREIKLRKIIHRNQKNAH